MIHLQVNGKDKKSIWGIQRTKKSQLTRDEAEFTGGTSKGFSARP